MKKKYNINEIKTWLRKWLLSYRFADFTADENLAIIEQAANRVRPYLDCDDELKRPVARSVAQYMAQSSLRPRSSRIATEMIASILLPIGLVRWTVEGWLNRRIPMHHTKGVRWNQSEFRYRLNPEIYHVPEDLAPDMPESVFAKARYLRLKDLKLLWEIAWVSWAFLPRLRYQWFFKIAKEMAWVRPLLDEYPSDYALIDAEYDCAISIMTLQARRNGQKLYNIMHGDKNISALDSFFEVDRCYCWNQFYVDQFHKLYAKADYFLYTNPTFILTEAEKNQECLGIGVFMPILETMPSDEEQQAFAAAMNKLAEQYPVSLRPHPIQMNQCDHIKPYLSNKVSITNPRAENSRQFAMRHEVIVGSASTALLESIMLGKETVAFRSKFVDDLARYHFSYHMPNCHMCDLKDLAATTAQYLAA